MPRLNTRLCALFLIVGLCGLLTAHATVAQQHGAARSAPDTFDLFYGSSAEGARTPAAAMSAGEGPDAFYSSFAFVDGDGVPMPPPSTPTPFTGYVDSLNGNVLTWTGMGAIDASFDAVTLQANGVYTIGWSGTVYMDKTDDSLKPKATLDFTVVVNGVPAFTCSTQKARDAYEGLTSSNYSRRAGCTAAATIQVKNKGAGTSAPPPFVFPKGTTIQLFMVPHKAGYSATTRVSAELQVVRVGK